MKEEEKEMNEKPNCYECEYKGRIPGGAHICCEHPANSELLNDPFAQVLGIFASVGRVAPIKVETKGIKVVGHPHGIKSGWFNHPFNFDPTWLVSCDGFSKSLKEV